MEHRVYRLALIAGIHYIAEFHAPFEVRPISEHPEKEFPRTKWSASLTRVDKLLPDSSDAMQIADCLGVANANSYEDLFESLNTHIKLNHGNWVEFASQPSTLS